MTEPSINRQKGKISIWKHISRGLWIIIVGSGGILAFLLPKLWPENKPPDAQIACSQTTGSAPLEVICDGLKSSDPEGKTLTYEWSIDGKITSHDSSLQVTFPTAKTYHIVLKVSDHKNLYDTDSVMIPVALPQSSPTVTPTPQLIPTSTPTPKLTDIPTQVPTPVFTSTPKSLPTFTPKPTSTMTPTTTMKPSEKPPISCQFHVKRILLQDTQRKTVEYDTNLNYLVKLGATITITIEIVDLEMCNLWVTWQADYGEVQNITDFTNTYTAVQEGGDTIRVFILDRATGKQDIRPITLNVIP